MKKIIGLRRALLTPLYLFLLLPFVLQGCTTLSSRRMASHLDRPPACQEFLLQLDKTVDDAGVRDASSFRVAGFPYLRASRFLAAMKYRVETDDEKIQWLRLMRELDSRARAKEIANLPGSALVGLTWNQAAFKDRDELSSRTEACASTLFQHDKSRPELLGALHESVRIPEEYSIFLRTVGLYPITTIPIDLLGEKQRRQFRKWYAADLKDLPVRGTLRSFAPPGGQDLPLEAVKDLLVASSRNPLNIPLPGETEKEMLARSFAPVYVQDVAAPYDLPGRIVRKGDGAAVDTQRPEIYYYFSHALLQGRPILQIVYVLWFPRRSGPAAPALERGELDGLTARVSLDGNGEVLMVDMMNNCGCYHLFAPRRDRVERVRANPLALDPFVPQWLPEVTEGKRLAVRINSGWHQVQRLFANEVPQESVRYELVPYETLEELPDGDGASMSVFNSAGIMKGSGRIEPLLLFSAGIPSVGSMRQRGHHAIEFRGNAHFDDPYLFEESFVFK
jgi:hypothetical protein